uniref:RRM domain-containing protein n=1 Tax=Scleropages formosus TaxID=113540 RepID=A0A8C9UWQ0_SCLFO
MATTIIHDSSEAVELCCHRRLFLKPISKMAITVTWPDLKEPSKTVSNWEVMANLKQMAHPLQFMSIRVSKSTLDFVRFEAELETKALRKTLCQKLNGCTLDTVAGDAAFRIFASECSADFPTRKEWESFFQEEEEWPDTLHLDGLPCKWFSGPQSRCQKPSEDIVREVFEMFGPIRNMDIPALDVYREETGSRVSNAFSVTGLQTFDVYIQFQEHEDLRNALETLRGMRLMLKEGDGKALVCNIKVSLDLTRHLSEAAVQKRFLERRQLEALEEKRQREKRYEREEEADRKRREDQRLKKRQEKLRRRAERQKEESEKRMQDTKVEIQQEESEKKLFDIQVEIQTQEDKEEELWEERKFVLVQRRLQSIRLLTALLQRAQVQVCQNIQPLPCKEAGWRRMVSDDGKSFQISLRNSDGGVCTEVSISQNSDQRNPSDEDGYKWKITIKETEPAQKRLGTQRNLRDGYSREFEVSWNDSSSQPEMHTTDQNYQDDKFSNGTYIVKDFDATGRKGVPKYICKTVSPPVHHRKSQSNVTFIDPSKHMEDISEDTSNLTGVLQQKCAKRMNVEGVYSLGKEKEKTFEGQRQGTELKFSKTSNLSMPQPDHEDHKDRKKTSKLSRAGDQVDVMDEIREKKKKKKEKYRDFEDENEEVIESELSKWKKSSKATSTTTVHKTHTTLSQDIVDFSFERKECENVAHYSNLKGIQSRYCGKKSANWKSYY